MHSHGIMESGSSAPTGLVKRAWGHCLEAKAFIILAALLFLTGIPAGFLFPEPLAPLLEDIKELAAGISGKSLPGTILYLCVHNTLSALFSLALGILFGIVPFLAAAANGLVMGSVFAMGRDAGMLLGYIIAVIPHGMFELPASILAWGFGLWLGAWPFRRNRGEAFRERVLKSARVFVVFILPLLFLAAVIEGAAVWLAGKLAV